MTPQPGHIVYTYKGRGIVSAKSRKNPGSAAVDKVADELERTYHRVIEALQNASPFDEQVKARVKQIMNEFADAKADAYED